MNKYRDNPQSMFYEHTYPEDRDHINLYFEEMRNIVNDPTYMVMNAALLQNQFSNEEIAEQHKERAIRKIKSQPYFKGKP